MRRRRPAVRPHGNDYIEEGDDFYCGAPHGPLRPDIIDGGPGTDTTTYAGRYSGVIVDLDGAMGDDGAPGEGDSVLAIENLHGTDWDDILTGSEDANFIDARSGNDLVYGLGGPDTLHGNGGNDKLYGGFGADVLNGGAS